MKQLLSLFAILFLQPCTAQAEYYKDQLYLRLSPDAAVRMIDKEGRADVFGI